MLGENEYGQLGLGDNTDRLEPTKLSTIDNVAELALGAFYSCALDNNALVYCWGWNGSGQLGLGDTDDRSTPTQVIALSSVSSIAAGDSHTCALDDLQQVWCWGFNGFGQLGLDDSSDRLVPTQVESSMENVSQLALGDAHSCAIDGNGMVWCWGWNGYAQLGLGANYTRYTPTMIPGFME